jgi:MoaA/NifB/PqqE/SkfB family radical SAM enzyme
MHTPRKGQGVITAHMKPKAELRALVDEEGRIVLPREVASRCGFKPGSVIPLDEKANGLSLRAPATRLAKLYVEPTNRCNLECRTCIRNSWDEPPGQMNDRTFARIIEGVKTFDCPLMVFFGGFGEPLSHPHIVDMVAAAHGAGARVELITNGTLLGEHMSRGLIDAGLDMLWASLDGSTPESYGDVRLGAALPRVIANLKRFAELSGRYPYYTMSSASIRPQIGIVFVAMKRNIDDLPSVALLGSRLGARRFLVTNVLPYTEEMRNEVLYSRSLSDRAFLPDSAYCLELPKIDIDKSTSSPLFWSILGGHTLSMAGADFGEGTDRCPFIDKGAAAIAWDGGLSPCLALLHSHTSFLNGRERVSKRHVVGNVIERDLDDLWKDAGYVALRDRIQRFDFSPCAFCGGCDLSERNEEDCIGNTAPTCGGCLWAQGVVQCP